MTCAGSPGTMRTRTNTSVSTANKVMRANASRLTRNALMRRPQGRGSPREPRRLGNRRRKVERSLELVAEIQAVLPRPHLQLLVDGDAAHLADEFLLCRLPQRLLLLDVGLHAGIIDVGVGEAAVR